MWCLRRR
jgi:hypothetical protein